MTFNNAGWAIDQATINSALARVATFAGTSGNEGIVQKGDLKVTALAAPAHSVQISAGSALVLNGYQGAGTDQSYVVTNPSVHTIPSSEMPAANPADKSYIVAVVVGDPEFSQVGHPFMLASDPPDGAEDTFQYVRPMLIPCGSGATSLGSPGYPAVVLARVDIPANATTITSGMITDLRALSQPRSQLVQGFAQISSGTKSITDSFQRFPDANAITVKIPSWAVKAKIMGFVEGMKLQSSGAGKFQPYMTTGDGRATGEATNIVETIPAHANERRTYNVGGIIDVTDIAGQTHSFAVQAKSNSSGDNGFITTDAQGSVFLSVYFEEQPT